MDIIGLLDQPRKLLRLLLFLTRIAINLVVASRLYVHFFGIYRWDQITNWQAWLGQFTSGSLLMWAFMYLISECMFFQLIPTLTQLIFFPVHRKAAKIKPDLSFGLVLKKILTIAEAGYFPKQAPYMLPAGNTDSFYKALRSLVKGSVRANMRRMQDSFIENLLNLSITFTLVYFIFLPRTFVVPALSIIILVALLIIFIIYISLCWLTDLAVKTANYFLAEACRALLEQAVRQILMDNRIFVPDPVDEKGVFRHVSFFHKQQSYILDITVEFMGTLANRVRTFELMDIASEKLLLVYLGEIDEQTRERIERNDRITIIQLSKLNQLSEKLNKFLKK